VLVLGRGDVDDDLTRAGRPAAGLEAEGGELLRSRRPRVEARAEVRAGAARLAVAADDLGLVGDVADRGADLRDRANRFRTEAATVGFWVV
jgi:hypothetical protein